MFIADDIDIDFNKFFKLKLLKKEFEKPAKSNILTKTMAKPERHLTKEQKQNKIKNYRTYLKQLKEAKYNSPEKKIIFNLTQEFLAKSIKARRLKLEERKSTKHTTYLILKPINNLTHSTGHQEQTNERTK
jgi:hypothetical protein